MATRVGASSERREEERREKREEREREEERNTTHQMKRGRIEGSHNAQMSTLFEF